MLYSSLFLQALVYLLCLLSIPLVSGFTLSTTGVSPVNVVKYYAALTKYNITMEVNAFTPVGGISFHHPVFMTYDRLQYKGPEQNDVFADVIPSSITDTNFNREFAFTPPSASQNRFTVNLVNCVFNEVGFLPISSMRFTSNVGGTNPALLTHTLSVQPNAKLFLTRPDLSHGKVLTRVAFRTSRPYKSMSITLPRNLKPEETDVTSLVMEHPGGSCPLYRFRIDRLDGVASLGRQGSILLFRLDGCTYDCSAESSCSISIPSSFVPFYNGYREVGYMNFYSTASPPTITAANTIVLYAASTIPLVLGQVSKLASFYENVVVNSPDIICKHNQLIAADEGYTATIEFSQSEVFQHVRYVEVLLPIGMSIEPGNVNISNHVYTTDYTVASDDANGATNVNTRQRYTITFVRPITNTESKRIQMKVNNLKYCPDIGSQSIIDFNVLNMHKESLMNVPILIKPTIDQISASCIQIADATTSLMWNSLYRTLVKCDLGTTKIHQKKSVNYQIRLCSGLAVYNQTNVVMPPAYNVVTQGAIEQCYAISYQVLDEVAANATPLTFNMTMQAKNTLQEDTTGTLSEYSALTKSFNSRSTSLVITMYSLRAPMEYEGAGELGTNFRPIAFSSLVHISPPLETHSILESTTWADMNAVAGNVNLSVSVPFKTEVEHVLRFLHKDLSFNPGSVTFNAVSCGNGVLAPVHGEFVANCFSSSNEQSNFTIEVRNVDLWSLVTGVARPPPGALLFYGVQIKHYTDFKGGIQISSTNTPAFIDYTRSKAYNAPVNHATATSGNMQDQTFFINLDELPVNNVGGAAKQLLNSEYQFLVYLPTNILDGYIDEATLNARLVIGYNDANAEGCVITRAYSTITQYLTYNFNDACGPTTPAPKYVKSLTLILYTAVKPSEAYYIRGYIRRKTMDSPEHYLNVLGVTWTSTTTPAPIQSVFNVQNDLLFKASLNEHISIITPTHIGSRTIRENDRAVIKVAQGWSPTFRKPGVKVKPINMDALESVALKSWGKDQAGNVVMTFAEKDITVNTGLRYEVSVPVVGGNWGLTGTQSLRIVDSQARPYLFSQPKDIVTNELPRNAQITQSYPILSWSFQELGISSATDTGLTMLRFTTDVILTNPIISVKPPHIFDTTGISYEVTFQSPMTCINYTAPITWDSTTFSFTFTPLCTISTGSLIAFTLKGLDQTLLTIRGLLEWVITIRATPSYLVLQGTIVETRMKSEFIPCIASRTPNVHQPAHYNDMYEAQQPPRITISFNTPASWRSDVTAVQVILPNYVQIVGDLDTMFEEAVVIGTLRLMDATDTNVLATHNCYVLREQNADLTLKKAIGCPMSRLATGKGYITLNNVNWKDTHKRLSDVDPAISPDTPLIRFVQQTSSTSGMFNGAIVFSRDDIPVYTGACSIPHALRTAPTSTYLTTVDKRHTLVINIPLLSTKLISPEVGAILTVKLGKPDYPVLDEPESSCTFLFSATNDGVTFPNTDAITREGIIFQDTTVTYEDMAIKNVYCRYIMASSDIGILPANINLFKVAIGPYLLGPASHAYRWILTVQYKNLPVAGYPNTLVSPIVVSKEQHGIISPRQMLPVGTNIRKEYAKMVLKPLNNYNVAHYIYGTRLIFGTYTFGDSAKGDLRLLTNPETMKLHLGADNYYMDTACVTNVEDVVTVGRFPYYICTGSSFVHTVNISRVSTNWYTHDEWSPAGYTKDSIVYPPWSASSLDLSTISMDFNNLRHIFTIPSKHYGELLYVVSATGSIAVLTFDERYGAIRVLASSDAWTSGSDSSGGLYTAFQFNNKKALVLVSLSHRTVQIPIDENGVMGAAQTQIGSNNAPVFGSRVMADSESPYIVQLIPDPVDAIVHAVQSGGLITAYWWDATLVRFVRLNSIQPTSPYSNYIVLTSFGRLLYVFSKKDVMVGIRILKNFVETTPTLDYEVIGRQGFLYVHGNDATFPELVNLNVKAVTADLAGLLLTVYANQTLFTYNVAFNTLNSDIIMLNGTSVSEYLPIGHAPVTVEVPFEQRISVRTGDILRTTFPIGYTSTGTIGVAIIPQNVGYTLIRGVNETTSQVEINIQFNFAPDTYAHIRSLKLTMLNVAPNAVCTSTYSDSSIENYFEARLSSENRIIAAYKMFLTASQRRNCEMPVPFRLDFFARSVYTVSVESYYRMRISANIIDADITVHFPPGIAFVNPATIQQPYDGSEWQVVSLSPIILNIPAFTLLRGTGKDFGGLFQNSDNYDVITLIFKQGIKEYQYQYDGNIAVYDYISYRTAPTSITAQGVNDMNTGTKSVRLIPNTNYHMNAYPSVFRQTSDVLGIVPTTGNVPRSYSNRFIFTTIDANMTLLYGITADLDIHRVQRHIKHNYPTYVEQNSVASQAGTYPIHVLDAFSSSTQSKVNLKNIIPAEKFRNHNVTCIQMNPQVRAYAGEGAHLGLRYASSLFVGLSNGELYNIELDMNGIPVSTNLLLLKVFSSPVLNMTSFMDIYPSTTGSMYIAGLVLLHRDQSLSYLQLNQHDYDIAQFSTISNILFSWTPSQQTDNIVSGKILAWAMPRTTTRAQNGNLYKELYVTTQDGFVFRYRINPNIVADNGARIVKHASSVRKNPEPGQMKSICINAGNTLAIVGVDNGCFLPYALSTALSGTFIDIASTYYTDRNLLCPTQVNGHSLFSLCHPNGLGFSFFSARHDMAPTGISISSRLLTYSTPSYMEPPNISWLTQAVSTGAGPRGETLDLEIAWTTRPSNFNTFLHRNNYSFEINLLHQTIVTNNDLSNDAMKVLPGKSIVVDAVDYCSTSCTMTCTLHATKLSTLTCRSTRLSSFTLSDTAKIIVKNLVPPTTLQAARVVSVDMYDTNGVLQAGTNRAYYAGRQSIFVIRQAQAPTEQFSTILNTIVPLEFRIEPNFAGPKVVSIESISCTFATTATATVSEMKSSLLYIVDASNSAYIPLYTKCKSQASSTASFSLRSLTMVDIVRSYTINVRPIEMIRAFFQAQTTVLYGGNQHNGATVELVSDTTASVTVAFEFLGPHATICETVAKEGVLSTGVSFNCLFICASTYPDTGILRIYSTGPTQIAPFLLTIPKIIGNTTIFSSQRNVDIDTIYSEEFTMSPLPRGRIIRVKNNGNLNSCRYRRVWNETQVDALGQSTGVVQLKMTEFMTTLEFPIHMNQTVSENPGGVELLRVNLDIQCTKVDRNARYVVESTVGDYPPVISLAWRVVGRISFSLGEKVLGDAQIATLTTHNLWMHFYSQTSSFTNIKVSLSNNDVAQCTQSLNPDMATQVDKVTSLEITFEQNVVTFKGLYMHCYGLQGRTNPVTISSSSSVADPYKDYNLNFYILRVIAQEFPKYTDKSVPPVIDLSEFIQLNIAVHPVATVDTYLSISIDHTSCLASMLEVPTETSWIAFPFAINVATGFDTSLADPLVVNPETPVVSAYMLPSSDVVQVHIKCTTTKPVVKVDVVAVSGQMRVMENAFSVLVSYAITRENYDPLPTMIYPNETVEIRLTTSTTLYTDVAFTFSMMNTNGVCSYSRTNDIATWENLETLPVTTKKTVAGVYIMCKQYITLLEGNAIVITTSTPDVHFVPFTPARFNAIHRMNVAYTIDYSQNEITPEVPVRAPTTEQIDTHFATVLPNYAEYEKIYDLGISFGYTIDTPIKLTAKFVDSNTKCQLAWTNKPADVEFTQQVDFTVPANTKYAVNLYFRCRIVDAEATQLVVTSVDHLYISYFSPPIFTRGFYTIYNTRVNQVMQPLLPFDASLLTADFGNASKVYIRHHVSVLPLPTSPFTVTVSMKQGTHDFCKFKSLSQAVGSITTANAHTGTYTSGTVTVDVPISLGGTGYFGVLCNGEGDILEKFTLTITSNNPLYGNFETVPLIRGSTVYYIADQARSASYSTLSTQPFAPNVTVNTHKFFNLYVLNLPPNTDGLSLRFEMLNNTYANCLFHKRPMASTVHVEYDPASPVYRSTWRDVNTLAFALDSFSNWNYWDEEAYILHCTGLSVHPYGAWGPSLRITNLVDRNPNDRYNIADIYMIPLNISGTLLLSRTPEQPYYETRVVTDLYQNSLTITPVPPVSSTFTIKMTEAPSESNGLCKMYNFLPVAETDLSQYDATKFTYVSPVYANLTDVAKNTIINFYWHCQYVTSATSPIEVSVKASGSVYHSYTLPGVPITSMPTFHLATTPGITMSRLSNVVATQNTEILLKLNAQNALTVVFNILVNNVPNTACVLANTLDALTTSVSTRLNITFNPHATIQSFFILCGDVSAPDEYPTFTLSQLNTNMYRTSNVYEFDVNPIQCGEIDYTKHSHVFDVQYVDMNYGPFALNAEARFTCNVGFEFQNTSTDYYKWTCRAAGWEGNIPVCLPVACPFFIEGADVQSSSTYPMEYGVNNYRSIIEYQCIPGYFVVDPLISGLLHSKYNVTCQADKTWSTQLPCQIRDCQTLPILGDGLPSTYTDPLNTEIFTTLLNTRAYYNCKPGYALNPTDVYAVCLATGWQVYPDNSDPYCKSAQCFPLALPPFTSVSYSNTAPVNDIYVENDTVTYTCDTGYYMANVTRRVRRCFGAEWLPRPTTCEKKKCTPFVQANFANLATLTYSHLSSSGAPELGSQAVFQCNIGYDAMTPAGIAHTPGSQTVGLRDCINNGDDTQQLGVWNAEDLLCNIHNCQTITDNVMDSVITYPQGTNYLAVAKYGCRKGFTFSGVVDRTCTPTVWFPAPDQQAVCRPDFCGEVSPITHQDTIVYHASANYPAKYQEGTVEYTCQAPYLLSYSNSTRPDPGDDVRRRTCGPTGWDLYNPRCIAPYCGPLDLPQYMRTVEYNNVAGYGIHNLDSIATYICLDGYRLSLTGDASSVRTCQADGSWSQSAPICIDIDECMEAGDTICESRLGLGSKCINLRGKYICAPTIFPGSIQIFGDRKLPPQVYPLSGNILNNDIMLIDTSGLDLLQFSVSKGLNLLQPIIRSIRYTSLINPVYTFNCTQITVIANPATVSSAFITLQCLTSTGVGTDMIIDLEFCSYHDADPNDLTLRQCYWSTLTGVTQTSTWVYRISYPPPELLPSTLRSTYLSERPYGSANVVGTTFAGEVITMRAKNILDLLGYMESSGLPITDDIISIRFGPLSAVNSYLCTISTQTQLNGVFCKMEDFTEEDSLYTILYDLYFNVTVGGQSVISTDSFSYPIKPIVDRIEGCTVDPNNSTRTIDCPTAGNVMITLHGAAFLNPMSLFIAGEECTDLERTNTRVVCKLPAGAGSGLSLSITTGTVYSEAVNMLSYSKPTLVSIVVQSGQIPDHRIDHCEYPSGGSPTSLALVNCDRIGTYKITFRGFNFGARLATITVGDSLCTDVQHDPTIPHNLVTCRLAAGYGENLKMVLTQHFGESTEEVSTLSYRICEVGQYWPTNVCIDCAPGTFSISTNARLCTSCPSGYFNSVPKSVSCQQCEPGTYARPGSPACTKCPIGRFSVIATSECRLCPSGSYINEQGSTQCKTCPVGSTNDIDHVTCVCNTGYFLAVDGTCKTCPDGGVCVDPGTTAYNIWPKTGYFPELDTPDIRQVLRFSLKFSSNTITVSDSYEYNMFVLKIMEKMFNPGKVPRRNFLSPRGYVTAGVDTTLIESTIAKTKADATRLMVTFMAKFKQSLGIETEDMQDFDKNMEEYYNKYEKSPSALKAHQLSAGLGWWSDTLPTAQYGLSQLNDSMSVILANLRESVKKHNKTTYTSGYSTAATSPHTHTTTLIFDGFATHVDTNRDTLNAVLAFLNEMNDPTSDVRLYLAENNIVASSSEVDTSYDRVAKEFFFECTSDACVGGEKLCNDGTSGPMCTICGEGLGRKGTYKCRTCDEERTESLLLLATIAVGVVICGILSGFAVFETTYSQNIPKKVQLVSITGFLRITLNAIQCIAIAYQFDIKWRAPMDVFLNIFDMVGSFGKSVMELDCFMSYGEYEMKPILVNSIVALLLPFILILACWILTTPIMIFRYCRDRRKYRRLQYIRVHMKATDVHNPNRKPVPPKPLGCCARVFKYYMGDDDEHMEYIPTEEDLQRMELAKMDEETLKQREILRKAFSLKKKRGKRANSTFVSTMYEPTNERMHGFYAEPRNERFPIGNNNSNLTHKVAPLASAPNVPLPNAPVDRTIPKRKVVKKVVKISKKTGAPLNTGKQRKKLLDEEDEDHADEDRIDEEEVVETSNNSQTSSNDATSNDNLLGDYASDNAPSAPSTADLNSTNSANDLNNRNVDNEEAESKYTTEYYDEDEEDDEEESTDEEVREAKHKKYVARNIKKKMEYVSHLSVALGKDLVIEDTGAVVAKSTVNQDSTGGKKLDYQTISHNALYSDYKKPTEEDLQLAMRLEESMSPRDYEQLQMDKRRFTEAQRKFYKTKIQLIYNVIAVVVTINYLLHPLLSRAAFLLLSCRKLGGGDTIFLQVDLSIECYTPEHYTLMFGLALPILVIWVFGMPILTLFLIFKNRALLHKRLRDVPEELQRKRLTLEYSMSFLYRGLRSSIWFWFIFDMAAKSLLIASCLFWAGEFFVQLVIASCITFFYICLQTAIRPYENSVLQLYAFVLLFCVFLIFFLVSFYSISNELISNGNDVITYLLVGVIAIAVLMFFVTIYRMVRRNLRTKEVREKVLFALKIGEDPHIVMQDYLMHSEIQKLVSKGKKASSDDDKQHKKNVDNIIAMQRIRSKYESTHGNTQRSEMSNYDSAYTNTNRPEFTGLTQTFYSVANDEDTESDEYTNDEDEENEDNSGEENVSHDTRKNTFANTHGTSTDIEMVPLETTNVPEKSQETR